MDDWADRTKNLSILLKAHASKIGDAYDKVGHLGHHRDVSVSLLV
jgi:hypothetical protein